MYHKNHLPVLKKNLHFMDFIIWLTSFSMPYTQKNFRNACYQVGFCTDGISTGATPQDKYCEW
jgi:hypothetical protein